MTAAPRKRLGELLVEASLITEQQLRMALQAQLIYGGRLGTNLVELDFISERFLAGFLANKLQLPSASPDELEDVAEDALALIPGDKAQKYGVIPLALDKKVLHVGMIDPSDLAALDDLAFVTGCQIRPKVASEVLVVAALERHYGIVQKKRYLLLTPAVPAPVRPPEPDSPEPEPELPALDDSALRPADISELTGDLAALTITGGGVPSADSLAAIAARMGACQTAEGVLDAVVAAWDPHFDGKVLVFALVGPALAEVVIATGPLEFRSRIAGRSVPMDRPHFLQLVYETQSAHAGIASDSPENIELFTTLDDEPSTPLLAMPLLLQGRVAVIVAGLGPRASLDEGVLRLLGIVLDKAAIAMEILGLRRRLLRIPEDVM